MGDLNFLEKLLDGVGVEWKSIEEITLPTKNIKWREVEGVYRYIDLSSVRETLHNSTPFVLAASVFSPGEFPVASGTGFCPPTSV